MSAPGSRVYPDVGNGGYRSQHTDVHLVYDSATNKLTVKPKKGDADVVFLVTGETRIVGPGVAQGTPSLFASLTKESRLNVTGRTDRATSANTARLVVIQAPKKPKTKTD